MAFSSSRPVPSSAPRLALSLATLALAGLSGLAGCSSETPGQELPDDGPVTSLYALVETIDGTSFYPPLGPDPVASGTFDATLLARLRVVLETTNAAGAVHELARFDESTSPTLRLFATHDTYMVNVPAAAYFTDPSLAYRFRVLLDGAELGRSDLSAVVFDVLARNPALLVGVKLRIEARPAPAVSAISPSRVARDAGDVVLTVNGSSFVRDSVVHVDGRALATTLTGGALIATVPAAIVAELGTHPVTVTTPAPGGGSSAAANLISYDPTPVLTAISPAVATAGSAALVLTLDGDRFSSAASVRFAGTALVTTWVSAQRLTAAVPAGLLATGGTFGVVVENGASTPSATLSFTVQNPAPVLTSLAPAAAPTGAAVTVTLTGRAFVAGAEASFDGAALATTFVNATTLTALVPAATLGAAGAHAITVANPAPNLGASGAVTFTTENPVPAITALAPASAAAGSTSLTLTLTGRAFVAGAQVTFGGAALATTYVSATVLTAVVPAASLAAAGSVAVTVSNATPNAGASAAFYFTVNNATAVLTSISPASAWVGGADFVLTASGSAFLSGAQIYLGATALPTTFVSATQLTAPVPMGTLLVPGNVNVTVTNPAPTAGASGAQTFQVIATSGTTCRTILESGNSTGNGVYVIDPDGNGPIPAFNTYCDMDNGGWTLLAKTVAAGLTAAEQTTITHGNWSTYTQTGYGSPASSSRLFWMPLTVWNGLTTVFPNNRLRVMDDAGDQVWINLSIGNAAAGYAINWTGCGGNYPFSQNGTCLQNEIANPSAIRGQRFTTWDRDNDAWATNCAVDNVGYNGGFWYSNCFQNSMLHASGTLYSWTENPGGGPVTPVPTSALHVWFRETGGANGIVGTGLTPETSGRSCRTILQGGYSRGDGLYWIDPDGLNTGLEPIQAYCLMTQNGGGWTLLGKTVASGVTSAVSSLIRYSQWRTYGHTGYGQPSASSSYYWMPLDQWHALTAAYPTNTWWIQDDLNSMTHNNLSIGTEAQNYVINWTSCGSQWFVWRDGTVCLDTGTGAMRGRGFTTSDADHDTWGSNCAYQNVEGYNGGFWYSNCYQTSMYHGSGHLYSWGRNPGSTPVATSQLLLWFY